VRRTPLQESVGRSDSALAASVPRGGCGQCAVTARSAGAFDLKLTEYREPGPTPLEEFVFFDHPSTRFRIHDAMRWREAMGTS